MKRKSALALATSLAALTLAACSTTPMGMMAASDPPPGGSTVAGRYLAAKFAAAAGDVKGAANFYAGTLSEDPENADLLSQAFMFAAESGDIPAAIALSDRVLAKDPDNRPALLVRQAGAFMKKDYAAAKDSGGSSQGVFTILTSSVVNAWAVAGTGDIDGALQALDALATQRGVEGLRLMHKALILDYAKSDEEADSAYRQALEVTGAGPRLADAYGRFLVRHNRIDEAKALYKRVEMENPGHPVAVTALRDIGAKKTFQPLVASPAEGVAEALFGIAASLNDRRSTEVAILYLNVTLYLRPNFDLARVLLANHYERLQRYELANTIYQSIQPSSPYFVMTQVQAAINDGRLDQPDNGVAKLKSLVDKGPQDPDVYIALGDLLRTSAHDKEAVGAYDKAVAGLDKSDRRLVQIYYARGVSLDRSDRWADAERDFRAALKINPERADVLNYLGYSFVDKGMNLEEAVAMLEKARALRPLDGYIADSVGWAYYKLGRYQEAARTLEEAVQLAPGAPDVNDHLGDAYWRVGRRIDARFQWQHALALNPDDKQKQVIERKLQFGLDAVSASGP